MIISFKRRPEDKVDPVIPHDQFGKMHQIRLDTAKARGSMMKKWADGGTPAVLDPPQFIFTESGSYEVIVGPDLMAPNGEIDVCDVNYYDYPKPPMTTHADQAPKTPPTR